MDIFLINLQCAWRACKGKNVSLNAFNGHTKRGRRPFQKEEGVSNVFS